MDDKIHKELEKIRLMEIEFWSIRYPSMNDNEKISFWCGSFNQLRRWTNESGIKDEGDFTEEEYKEWKSRDPDIDKIILRILDKIKAKNIFRPF